MNKLQFAVAAFVAIAAGAAQAQVSVGASVNINVPGVYGRVDIGVPVPGVAFMPPPVVYTQPVVIAPTPIAVQQRPIYLYVPEVQQRDWGRYCAGYGACGQPVYFVRETWVRDRYEKYHHDNGRRGHDDDDDDDDGDHGHEKHHGNGHGHGHGHDK